MAARVFSPGPATDQAYINLRDRHEDYILAARELIERLWTEFRCHADSNFLLEVRNDFYARVWEMYLTCVMLEGAIGHGYRVSCPKPGPDILLEFEGHRIWIEAVIATNGMPGLPDTLVEPNPDRSGRSIEERIVLRYTTAVREKYCKYFRYLRRGRIHKDDGYVIAVNGASLSYRYTQAENDAPRFLKALYPLSAYQLVLDRQTREIVAHQNEPRFQIAKTSGKTVSVGAFLERRSRGISAVLHSFASPVLHPASLGFDFELAYNPMGRCPLLPTVIPAKRTWTAELLKQVGSWWGSAFRASFADLLARSRQPEQAYNHLEVI